MRAGHKRAGRVARSLWVAKPRQQKLKVFQAQLGFYESVVAAPSQAAALKAWGVRQDLFAEGQAHLAADEAAASAALAHPGEPLRRALGARGAFEIEPAGLPSISGQKRQGRAAKAPARTSDKPKPALPDRSALDAAEAALRALDQEHQERLDDLERRRRAIEAERVDAEEAYDRRREAAASAVKQARRAYRRAGGDA